MKKILIFCLYCVVFTLIPAASILAQGGKDNLKNKPFPALEVPADDEDEFSTDTEITGDGREERFFVFEMSADNEAGDSPPAETIAVNGAQSSPVPEIPAVNNKEEYKEIDWYSRSGAEANSAAAASAAESAAAAAQFAAAAAQSAKAAESAAAAVAASAASPQPPPNASQPASSRVPPQPPVRTIAPTVNIIVPSAAPPAAPSAYRPSMNVTPGMPDPYCNGVYRVQLGAFSNTGLAQQCFNRLKSAGFTPYYEQYGSLYRVVITGIQAADMAAVIQRLEAAGFNDAWIREER